jgi:ElaB/YqjD/DUF883 family membrane-anchored ribosome-binding protein
MAKKRSGGKMTRVLAADRLQSGSRRQGTGSARGQSSKRSSVALAPRGFVPPNETLAEYASGERSLGRGVMSGARDLAGKVGKTTRNAAQSTVGAAREFAAGAADVAGSVANRAGRTASQVAGKVRENPWPTLLIGAGATWLAIDAIRGRSAEADTASMPRRGSAGGRSSASERGAVGQAMSRVARAGRAAGGQIEEFVRERPLLAGAATLGLGVAVGMAMPSSVTENQLFGETRDKLVSRAREAARGTMEKVREVTSRV